MPINITIKSQGEVNLNHLSNIALEFYGEPSEIRDGQLDIYFANNDYANRYSKIIDPYFSNQLLD